MPQYQANRTNRLAGGETAFIGELQRFTDPPGGASLDNPKVRARKRRGRPTRRRKASTSQDEKRLPLD